MTDQLQVYSHPRSGTNFLCAFIGKNFYPGRDLTGKEGVMGHWASPVSQDRPWAYGALFGSHYFYFEAWHDAPSLAPPSAIYIYRDGRDVAVSFWRTKAFLHPSWRELSFSEYLRREDQDWLHSPGWGGCYDGSIAKHWHDHLESWRDAPRVLLVRFEDLVFNPVRVRAAIACHFDLSPLPEMIEVKELVGPFPHEGRAGAWREIFSDDDLAYFHEIVPSDFWGLYDDGL